MQNVAWLYYWITTCKKPPWKKFVALGRFYNLKKLQASTVDFFVLWEKKTEETSASQSQTTNAGSKKVKSETCNMSFDEKKKQFTFSVEKVNVV